MKKIEQKEVSSMKHEAYYGLPGKVKFCSNCVISNQRPSSEVEFKHTIETKKKTIPKPEGNIVTVDFGKKDGPDDTKDN